MNQSAYGTDAWWIGDDRHSMDAAVIRGRKARETEHGTETILAYDRLGFPTFETPIDCHSRVRGQASSESGSQ